MKKVDLGQVLTILANVGVIVGIVFLAIEIRQIRDNPPIEEYLFRDEGDSACKQ